MELAFAHDKIAGKVRHGGDEQAPGIRPRVGGEDVNCPHARRVDELVKAAWRLAVYRGRLRQDDVFCHPPG
eukprot:CAMPEP_0206056004 /NCGR_PEP_ID=MMETSP1466-20131121/41256_1 /ASSEMBLY_ACC=CAM_ASM_001126 /TAXON_ID=44452 /ORGANISM="Pavlova gyrans, Strain CCMP608" /LENGTH=70 /DNA_ID=CAMNT_0053431235 /DNA_START=18 /DNA_END=226 /DNA_ORIENTATION=+